MCSWRTGKGWQTCGEPLWCRGKLGPGSSLREGQCCSSHPSWGHTNTEAVTRKLFAALDALLFTCKFKYHADEPSKWLTSHRVLVSMVLIYFNNLHCVKEEVSEQCVFHTSGFNPAFLQGHQKYCCPYQTVCVCVCVGPKPVVQYLFFFVRRSQRSFGFTATRNFRWSWAPIENFLHN